MNVPVTITSGKIGEEEAHLVDARELHAFLEVKTLFKDWIVRRIQEYGFIDNVDFSSFLSEIPGHGPGRPSKEYHLSLDMAKELCMVERTEKGRMARLYFIDCEKRLKTEMAHRAIPERRSQHQYFAVAAMCKALDKYLGGIATARALEYFTGMPTADLVERIEARQEASAGFSMDMAVQLFVGQRCNKKPGARASATALYTAFCDWMAESYPTRRKPSQKLFGQALQGTFEKEKTGGLYWYEGVELEGT